MNFASVAVRCFVVFALLFAASAQAQRQAVPVINYENQPVARVNGIWPSKDEVRQAIVRGASAHQWTVVPAGDDNMLATLNVRGKHTVVVDIEYSAEKFSIRYRSSVNMKAGKQYGQDVIHPYYNRWTQTLLDAIRIELNKG